MSIEEYKDRVAKFENISENRRGNSKIQDAFKRIKNAYDKWNKSQNSGNNNFALYFNH